MKNRDLTEEMPVYPGHPVTIAYQIMSLYPDLETAKEKGYKFPKALEDIRVSGGGGRVYSALDLLQKRQDGETWEQLFEWADKVWASEHFTIHELGQKQADLIKKTNSKSFLGKRWLRKSISLSVRTVKRHQRTVDGQETIAGKQRGASRITTVIKTRWKPRKKDKKIKERS